MTAGKGTTARQGMTGARLLAVLLAASAFGACSTYTGPVPVVDRGQARPPATRAAQPQPAAPSAAAPEGYYVVKKGDTLYSIALEHGADYREVAQWNGLDDPTKIRVGQQLRVKAPPEAVQVGTAKGHGRPEARPLDGALPQGANDGGAKPEARAQRPPPPKESVAAAAPVKADPEGISFIWPAKGKVIAGFAEPRSKGIDIDGKPGDPIVAAAPGRVTYIGTGIPGLGKLIVLKHENGFITVYAHNKEIVVKEQQNVARGQKIAELGSTDSDRPKLHFQIRKGSSPVDPMRYLPGS